MPARETDDYRVREAVSDLGPFRSLEHTIDAAVAQLSVAGFSRVELKNFFWRDLEAILIPTISQHFAGKKIVDFDSTAHLATKAEARATVLAEQLHRLLLDYGAIRKSLPGFESGMHNANSQIKITSLARDTHNGGKRPVLIEDVGLTVIAKSTDPTASLIYDSILALLNESCSLDLVRSPVIARCDDTRYFVNQILPSPPLMTAREKREFCTDLGYLLGVSYCLRMVDLHFENVLVSDKRPVVVDPECILYDYDLHGESDRLVCTGIVGPVPQLTAMLGGMSALYSWLPHLSETDTLLFRKQTQNFGNRATIPNGEFFNPLGFRRSIKEAFRSCCNWFEANREMVVAAITPSLVSGSRMRHLVRKTRQYSVAMHATNLPIARGYKAWIEHIEGKFANSGGFVRNISERLVACELEEMRRGDVPYFWTDPRGGGIWLGAEYLQKSEPDGALCDRLYDIVGPPCTQEFGEDLVRLDEFLSGNGIAYYSQIGEANAD